MNTRNDAEDCTGKVKSSRILSVEFGLGPKFVIPPSSFKSADGEGTLGTSGSIIVLVHGQWSPLFAYTSAKDIEILHSASL